MLSEYNINYHKTSSFNGLIDHDENNKRVDKLACGHMYNIERLNIGDYYTYKTFTQDKKVIIKTGKNKYTIINTSYDVDNKTINDVYGSLYSDYYWDIRLNDY